MVPALRTHFLGVIVRREAVRRESGRRRQRDAEASRERILDAAEDLFAESGYDATPTARIAERAKVPKGLIFHYFATKADVLRALLTERAHVDEMKSLEVEPVRGDVAATLTRVAERFRAGLPASPKIRRILFREAGTEPEAGRLLGELHMQALHAVRTAIDAALDGVRERVPGSGTSDAAAAAFTSALFHDLNLRQLTGAAVDLAAIAAVVARGLLPPGPVFV